MKRLKDNQLVRCAAFLLVLLTSSTFAAEYVESSIKSDIVPGPVEFAALLPDGYDRSGEPYPLLLNLHGGGGNRMVLRRQQPIFEEMWQDGSLSKLVVDRIKHEYHLVRGADHIGSTLRPRTREALAFLHRHLNPPPPDAIARAARRRFQRQKDRLGVKGHFDE